VELHIPPFESILNQTGTTFETIPLFSEKMKMTSTREKKPNDTHIEDVDPLKLADEKGQGDYSGATAKTDPREIRLVRKLDTRIMPIMWAMYFLNYVS
jgi:hypothetical protein